MSLLARFPLGPEIGPDYSRYEHPCLPWSWLFALPVGLASNATRLMTVATEPYDKLILPPALTGLTVRDWPPRSSGSGTAKRKKGSERRFPSGTCDSI